jgi:hypothetical protein
MALKRALLPVIPAGTLLEIDVAGQSWPEEGKVQVNRLRSAVAALLLVSFVGAVPAVAQPHGRARGHYKHAEKREAREAYWDASRHYRRDDRRYRVRRLGREDRIYRGSDNRYYCKRDDGTSGLIIGGLAGGVLGNVIAPGGSKTIGTIAGAGIGAIIGKTIDDGEIVCR